MDDFQPTFYLDEKQLKEIKKWKVGEEYDLIVSVKMTGSHMRDNGTMSGDFEVTNVMAADKEIDDMDSNEFSDYTADQKRRMAN